MELNDTLKQTKVQIKNCFILLACQWQVGTGSGGCDRQRCS